MTDETLSSYRRPEGRLDHGISGNHRLRRDRGLPQITRLPIPDVGDWVQVSAAAPEGLAGRVFQITGLYCRMRQPREKPLWFAQFESGRAVPVSQVERFATEAEIRREARRPG